MSKSERNLSKYIDRLNAEKKPNEHGLSENTPEQESLFETVRLVRSLKEPVLPGNDYPKKVAQNVAAGLKCKSPVQKSKKTWFISAAAVAAVIVIAIILNFTALFNKSTIAYAMEQAFQGIKAYHGVLEITETNAEGEKSTQAKLEVWADKEGRYFIKELEGSQAGLTTVNNGQKKWQLRPDQKQMYILAAFPDPYRFTFELGREVDEVRNAIKSKAVGEEVISGRKATILEVYPQGGMPYKLWIDNETKLPLQKQSGMQNALQYTVGYAEINFSDTIPAELTAYNLPAGFKEINTQPEQIVSNLIEAQGILGFTLKIPETIPGGYRNDIVAVETEAKTAKFNYTSEDKAKKIVILESKASKEFKPAATAILGKVGSSTAEVQSPIQEGLGILGGGGPYAGVTGLSSIRWQQEGFEYAVIGNVSLGDIVEFVKSLKSGEVQIQVNESKTPAKPQVEVPVDLKVEENDQKSADSGHSPWKLNPAFVTQVFVNLKISPEGINGDYPIKYEELNIIQNTGSDAIVEVKGDKTPLSKVYLKKLVRQDNTGIWTVVGYDPAR